ncbi:secreted phage protein [Streptococcus equi subsp. zooepidemicus SzAM60]|nr:secreted phage protein [Streptococcus equi subsp. zooepidemicus SzAM60]
MKKKLVMILALCAVGVSANVKAEVYGNQKVWGFRTD